MITISIFGQENIENCCSILYAWCRGLAAFEWNVIIINRLLTVNKPGESSESLPYIIRIALSVFSLHLLFSTPQLTYVMLPRQQDAGWRCCFLWRSLMETTFISSVIIAQTRFQFPSAATCSFHYMTLYFHFYCLFVLSVSASRITQNVINEFPWFLGRVCLGGRPICLEIRNNLGLSDLWSKLEPTKAKKLIHNLWIPQSEKNDPQFLLSEVTLLLKLI